MSNFNVLCPLNQIVDIAWPGTPFPNTGIIKISSSFSNGGFYGIQNQSAGGFQVKANVFIATPINLTIVTQNAVGTQFTDIITLTMQPPLPDATDSGLTISAPHA